MPPSNRSPPQQPPAEPPRNSAPACWRWLPLDDDIAFHSLILEASHNDAFKALTDVVAEVLSGRARLTGQVQVPQLEALKLHERVASAIATGNATAAESSMRDLVAEVRSALLERGLRGFLEA